MPRTGKARSSIAIVAVVLTTGVLVGSVIAAQRSAAPVPDVDRLQAAIDAEPMTKVAAFSGDDQASRGVFVQELATGHLCVWDAPSAASRERRGGCNPIDDPLGGSAVSASLTYDGGPATEQVKDARLSGLAAADVATVAVLMSDGSEREVRLRRTKLGAGVFLAFGYRFKKADLRNGVGPIAVIARNSDGAEVARQQTGIG